LKWRYKKLTNNDFIIADNVDTGQLSNDSENENNTKKSDDDIKIQILSHEIIRDDSKYNGKGIYIVVNNVSEFDIAEAVFETKFYDITGEIIDNVNYSLCDLKKGKTRKIRIVTQKDVNEIVSYTIEILKLIPIPVPTAIGNNEIQILDHSLQKIELFSSGQRPETLINIAIRNISEKTIATAFLEITLLDGMGIILDKIVHKELYIKSKSGRRFDIAIKQEIQNKVKSYNIRVTKAITADVEKVQICSHRIRTNDNGEEEVAGSVKNISDVNTDIAVVATFKDKLENVIGVKILSIKNIEPGRIKNFDIVFTNPLHEHINSFRLDLGDMVEPIEANS
jgi:hypothetical protein